MGGSGYVTERVAEAAGAKVDGGQGGNEEQPPSSLAEGSCDGGASEGAEAVAVPLIIPGEGLDRDSVPQPLMQVSPYVRQRSAVIGIVEGLASGKRYVPFDVQNGLHASQSMLKLEELERAAESSVSTIVVLKTLFYISVWYTFSTCLTLYNKTLLGDKLGKFPAPLLMNTFHFTLQAVLSKIVVCIQSRGGDVGATMTWKDYFSKVVPTALGTALDINLSNVSLVFISVTFATMCKSASPIFLLLFAFAFRLETPSIKLLLIIIIISFGILLTVAKETEFQFWGFIFVMFAAVMSGFRWSMTQILLQKESYGLKNPITLMSYVTPAMAVVTLILSLVIDPWHDFDTNVYFDNSWHVIRSCLLMLTGGALAFFMVLTEYILISATSAVTVSIAGVVKEAVTIVVAVFYFHDPFTLLKGVGLLIIIIGVSLFNWYKYEKMKGQLRENDDVVSSSPNGAAKYVILDDMELPYDET
ncbi:probable sugar phosphate/phosphate translocator At1g06470 isoform X1 [Zingiber officinale]|uniref:probable sugar phosphate/phosphate translocator At1g06470 isoform X1 n=1 Tax=Zingiber officinale TaxID=94328 RepID=UPI001C4CFD71|nr:probable sugar phosphate/phosphate translocator At1g06470 isoform X1 [Zingiber officinale]XP_042434203.1 probable sugar phosphate/phosphate translocator At1g06470 isoform X1 [Zingiber officinale]